MKAVLRYLGAKNKIAPWIIAHFPEHKYYVEPFGGSGAVLLNKPPAKLDVYNDLFGRITNFFRVLRDHSDELIQLIELTPYSQDEYHSCHEPSENPVEDARRFAVTSMMGYGGGQYKPGFRRGGLKRHTPCPQSWNMYPDTLRQCAQALKTRNIEISNIDALEIMQKYDSPETLHYVDPPYPHETRTQNCRYHLEYNREDHERLLHFLSNLEGMVVLSTYDTDFYGSILKDYKKVTKPARTTQGTHKMETLYLIRPFLDASYPRNNPFFM